MPKISDQSVVAEAIAAHAEIDENIQPEPTTNTQPAVVADTVEAEAVMSHPPADHAGAQGTPDPFVIPAAAIESNPPNLQNDAKPTPAPDKAPGKFAPAPKSFKTMTIPELHDRIGLVNSTPAFLDLAVTELVGTDAV
jgi:hypothetical protein